MEAKVFQSVDYLIGTKAVIDTREKPYKIVDKFLSPDDAKKLVDKLNKELNTSEIKPIELFVKYEKMQDWQKLEFMQFVADAINHTKENKK